MKHLTRSATRRPLPCASAIASLVFAAGPLASLRAQTNWIYNGTTASSATAASNQWGNALSWSAGVPNAEGATANFTLSTTSARTITLDGDRTVGTLNIDDPATAFVAYTFNAGTPSSSRLIFDAAGGSAALSTPTATNTQTNVVNAGITLNDPLVITTTRTNVNGGLNLAGVISDGAFSHSITKEGNGQLILGAANDYDGGTTINGGRLQAGAATALGSGAVTVNSGGQFYMATAATFANDISIAGNGYANSADAAAQLGALRYQNSTTSGTITLTGDARIGAFGTTAGTIAGPLTGGARNLEINSASNANHTGSITVTGNASGLTGTVTVSRGSLTLGPASNLGGNLEVRDGATLAGEATIAGNLVLGNAGATTTGATLVCDPTSAGAFHATGDLTLNGTTLVTPSVPVSGSPITVLTYGGTLSGAAANLDLVGGITSYRPGTTFDLSTPGQVKLNMVSPALVWSGAVSNSWNSSDANWVDGATPETFFNRDRVTFNETSAVQSVSLSAGSALSASIVTFDHSTAVTYQLSGPGTLTNSPITKKGSGKLVIGSNSDPASTANVITGTSPVTIESGTLAGSSMTPISTGTTITMGNASTGTAPTVLEVPASQSTTNDFTTLACPLVLSPDAPNSRAIIRYAGGPSVLAPSFSGAIQLNGRDIHLENTSGSNLPARLYNVSGAVSGTGNVRIRCGALPSGEADGTSRVRLTSTSNTFSGDLYIETGNLQTGFSTTAGSEHIPNSALLVMSPGTVFGLATTAETIRGLVGGAASDAVPFVARVEQARGDSNTARLTVSDSNAANTHVFDGRISNGSAGPVALTKAGAATQVLRGVNTYTGTTVINGGTLEIGGAGQFGGGDYAGAITIGAGATLKFNSTADQVLQTGVISGAGGLVKENTGTLTLSGVNTFSGDITVNGGTLIGAGAQSGGGGVPVFGSRVNTRTFTVNNGATLQFNSGNIVASGYNLTTAPTLVINSGGTVTNGGIATNSALNEVRLNGGTLTSTTGHLGSTSGLPVYGAWNLNGSVTSTGTSAISTSDPTKGWVMLKVPGDRTTDFNIIDGTLTVSAPVVDNPTDGNIGFLSKSGEGTMILSAVNTYRGDTTVNAGTLVLADDAQLRFVIGNASGVSNRLTGTGSVTLNGDFFIDTSAADGLTSGTWTLEDVSTLTGAYGASFSVVGFTDAGNHKWTRQNGPGLVYTFDETTGVLTLAPGASYASWIDGFFPGETDPAVIGAAADPDKDSLPNGVELVVGGDPKSGMDTALLPAVELVTDPVGTPAIPAGDYLLFTWRRSDLSVAAGVTAVCETSANPATPWTPVAGIPGVIIQVDDNHSFTPPAAAATDRVRVYVPRGADPVRFGRLKALVP